MSSFSWSDLNNRGNLLKVNDKCPNPKCKCRKQITFTPKEFQLEEAGLKNAMKKIFKGTEKCERIKLGLD